ncbi:MAG: phosphate propanoyltransferase [Thermincolia bacterium]
MDREQLISVITETVMRQMQQQGIIPAMEMGAPKIPLGISNRHVHISTGELTTLFGVGAELTRLRDLSQPGQIVSEQMVTLVGPKGVIEKVRILGPMRPKTQVEISVSDCFKLGIRVPIRDSGDLKGSARITLVGPVGSVTLEEGCIISARHIHMHPKDAEAFGVGDGERVNVKASGPRGIVFTEVLVRVNEKFNLEMHLDVDEANAASLANGDLLEIV